MNKVLTLKKKFNLPLGTSNKGSPEKATTGLRKASQAAGPNDTTIPKTASKQRVIKSRATSSTKKSTPKGKKGKTDEDVTAELGDKDEEMNEYLVDKESESKAAYEEVFGRPDTEDDEEAEDEEE